MFAASQIVARDVAELVAALKACTASCVILLSPGDWRDVRIEHIDAHATITGKDAVIHDLRVAKSSGITFSNLEFSSAGAKPGAWGASHDNWFGVYDSTDIQFDHVRVHGDPNGTFATTSSGLMIRTSSNVKVSYSDFSHLYHAVTFLTDEKLLLDHNQFHDLFDDAMRGGGTSWITISNNVCSSNHPDAADMDHPDCIQFWTANATAPAHDITITDNRYDRGTAHPTQFIFLGNEKNLPYENVRITGNRAYGSLWAGIAISNAHNVVIEKNTLISSCRIDGPQLIRSRITFGGIDGLSLFDNVAGEILERPPNPNKTQGNNRIAGCMDHSPF